MPNNREYNNNNIEKYKQHYQEKEEIRWKREHLYYQKNKTAVREKQGIYFRNITYWIKKK